MSVEEKTEEMIEETAGEAGFMGKFRDSALGKTILGEDSKFDKEDVKRLAGEAGDSFKTAVGKMNDNEIIGKIKNTVLGDDGKFDGEDIKRLASEAENSVKETINKVKDKLHQ